ncbi:myosin phosphatase Rho-interacting protein-like isoform X2 [Anabas testudineus]|uniref:myosin phosphatase Rho-interacting protein-like isoform X2 n=1 Tax=Anabas testudineus TaxID=64144 RepID=UPI000E465C92|nr:myosin phosphatase Rho-interacting protein-like isoform X2 [Anabas testudineus]
MSGEKATNSCNKFQANIFNKSKCQNCFKSRELHLLNDHDMGQAKPIYGGWLCLAPEGTDFDNPMQRSRKWQRRFFILYEHGSLSFALDELPSTLPQGTVNMNLCTDITDAEPRTGQRNALCIITPEQEIFIRGDSKEIINGWSEQLAVYLRTNKQNQNKKRKVEPVATQEPSPAKMAATDTGFPSSECSAVSSRWQEDQLGRRPDVTSIWTVTDPPGPEQTPAGRMSTDLCSRSSFSSPISGLAVDDHGSTKHLAESNSTGSLENDKNRDQHRSNDSIAEGILGLEASKKEQEAGAAVSRKGRSEARTNKREKLQSCGDITQLSVPHPHRRAKSLDGRTSDNPDLLNFKKGWMVKLDENDQWKKYWFVLSTDSLRYYKDSVAEEASAVEGEIDLTKCYNVSEYQVQRNYGFQIHTPKAVYTLSAMTAGIRRNWIQALIKNVHPANAPDVASLPGHQIPCSPPEAFPKPDVTRDSPSADVPTDRDFHLKPRSVMERRQEGRYKTFDWAEFRPQNKLILETDPQKTEPPCLLEMGDLERRKRREERRRRYESMLGLSLGWEEIKEKTVGGRALSPTSHQKVEEEIEDCWKQVENTVFRLERTVPLYSETKDAADMENLLDSYRKWVEDLKAKLEESEHRRLELESQLSTAGCQQQLDPSLFNKADFCPWGTDKKSSNNHTQTLKDVYEDSRELLQQQNIIAQDIQEQLCLSSPFLPSQTPSILLHDTEGNFQELGDLLSDSVAIRLVSPPSNNQDLLSLSDGQAVELHLDVATNTNQNQLDREDSELFPSSETQINNREYDSSSLILEKSAEGDDNSLNCCIEQHIPPDQAMVRRLSQEVELLTNQNKALNQRNQEMLNQLTEADREIERLKAELSSRYTEPHHLLEVEQQGKMRVEDLESELSLRNQELLEAQTLITSLEENLREAEALPQLNVLADREEPGEVKSNCATKAEEYLLQCFKATEAKLSELERQLDQSELTCRELQAQNSDLKETAAKEKLYGHRAEKVDTDIQRLNQGLEEERIEDINRWVSGEERIQQVMEGMVMRLQALRKLLEVIDRLDLANESEHEEEKPTVESQVKWEEGFWSRLLHELQANASQTQEEKHVGALLREVTEQMMLEKQVLLLGHGLLSGSDEGDKGEALKDLDIIGNNASVTAAEPKKTDESKIFNCNDQVCDIEHFKTMTQMNISLINHITSSVRTSAPEKLQYMADRLHDCHLPVHLWSGLIHSAATEALYCCRLSRLQSKYDQDREKAKHKLLTSSLNCSNCAKLMAENGELEVRLQQASSCVDKRDTCCQTDETYSQGTELQIGKESVADEIREENVQQAPETTEDCMEILISDVEGHLGIEEVSDENTEKNDETLKETVPSEEMDQVSVLRRRVEELEELLSVMMKEDFDGQMSSVQMQHRKEMEKLKATCEHGFASMEESHLKMVEELQRQHQQQVERLLMERDRLLEEESAATATAIEAIKNAHRLELERELQKRCQSESSSGNSQLQDIYRQHSEELTSYQQELEVLSQQFCLKCLENGHLVQALDAERKALCQCQQENQDLRTRNQELSGHLAAEITRLCSLAKQDDLPLSQGMDVYEMEITLRVKESEVQCLKQANASLKDELQSAQRDKRNATKKYKDMYTELSIVRAQAERKMDELRENLRLAHQALAQTSL